MVTIITATGSPILLPFAHDARMQAGQLVCVDAAGERLLAFDPIDVMAYAVESHERVPQWIMGGPALGQTIQEAPVSKPIWRLAGLLRFTYR